MKSGEQSVKVRSYETFQPGNKLSSAHGQKGVDAAVLSPEDMPMCYTADGTQITPDVVMAVSSIVTRQTLGQIYESGASLERVKNPALSRVISADEIAPLGEDVSVMDGRTGRFYRTALYSEEGSNKDIDLKRTVATVGFVRLFNQSQMTRERHFTSHRSMTSRTLRTPIRRSKGGALRAGEMEVQASIAAGLVACVGELRRRGDEVVIHLCARCQRLRLLHSCTETNNFVEITLPYDTVVLDCVSKIVYNSCFVYDIEPDT
jgi:DNA-directed RNA polymerase beta subunit